MALYEASGIGYRGFLIVENRLIPCTGAGPDIAPTLIVPDNIHGSSEDSSAFRIHYAEGQENYRGDIRMPFYQEGDRYSPGDNSWWDIFVKWAYLDRTTPKDIIVSPDGANVYTYKDVYVTTFTIDNRGANNLIEVTLGLEAKSRSKEGSAVDLDFASCQSLLNKVPVPYWRSKVVIENIYTTQNFEAVSWRIEVRHNTVVTHVANGSKAPYSIKQALINVTGTITIYNPDGVPEPDSRVGKITIYIGGDQSTYYTKLELLNVAVETYPYPMRDPNAITTRDLNFQAFAGAYDCSDKSNAALIIS